MKSRLKFSISFLLAVLAYFYINTTRNHCLISVSVVKVVPIIILHQFVRTESNYENNNRAYKLKNGLLLSALGDFFLVWPYLFVLGVICFSFAHVFYMQYFEPRPKSLKLGAFLLAIDTLVFVFLYPTLTGCLKAAIPLYSFLLVGMLWTSIDQINKPGISLFSVCGTIGGALFTLSDIFIAIEMFTQLNLNLRVPIMILYYVAQFTITMNIFKSINY